MTHRPFDELYFEWLFSLVAPVDENGDIDTWSFARQLYTTPFTPHVLYDNNRVEDVHQIREDFIYEHGEGYWDQDWFELDASMLEILVILARRGEFETDEPPSVWFLRMVSNANLTLVGDHIYTKEVFAYNAAVLKRINDRTYAPNGAGSLFPLRAEHGHQHVLDLWYQMQAWILENYF